MKVTIIEDEEILLKVLKEKFEDADFEVSLAIDGEEAMRVVREKKPDIIVLDILLPKKDGFAVLKELKADPTLMSIPVIVLSNLGQDEEIKKALSLGAADYLVKTQNSIKEVVEKVKNYLASIAR